MATGYKSLPPEIILEFASHMDDKTLGRLSLTDRFHSSLLAAQLRKAALADKDGYSALHWACKKGHRPLATLVMSNVTFDESTIHQRELFCYVSEERYQSNLEDHDGDQCKQLSVIHLAAKRGWADVVRMLVKAGADVNAGALDGGSESDFTNGTRPLVFAEYSGDLETVNVLLEAGAAKMMKATSET